MSKGEVRKEKRDVLLMRMRIKRNSYRGHSLITQWLCLLKLLQSFQKEGKKKYIYKTKKPLKPLKKKKNPPSYKINNLSLKKKKI